MHVSVILLFDIHNVSKFVIVTNRIIKGAKRERELPRVPVNPIQTGLFLPPPPFLKNYKRYRHETYTIN